MKINVLKTTTLLILISLSCFSFGQNLKSKIKVEKITKYEGYRGKLDSIGTLQQINIYDTAFNKTIGFYYCESTFKCRSHVDSFYTKGEYLYDDKNYLLEERIFIFGYDTAKVIKKNIRYENEQGQVFKKLVVTIENLGNLSYDSTLFLFDYDKTGNIIKKVSYSLDYRMEDSELWATVINYKYDKQNNLKMEEKNGNSYSYKYNKKGDVIECSYKGDVRVIDGSKSVKWVYRYDKNRNQILEIEYKSDKSFLKTVSTYDKSKNKISDYFYDEVGNLKSRKEYLYNLNGDLIEDNYYSKDNKLFEKIIYEYEYYDEKK